MTKQEQALEDFLASFPKEKQQRMRAIQWRLEQDLCKYKDPIARMNRMVVLFWEGVNKFKDELR